MAMNTLDELKYYCNEKAPAGALMLIGEWGCGKTYMVDHMLAEALRDSHIFIRISLFGIDSMDAVSNTVTQAWINAALEEKGKVGAWMKKATHAKQAIAEVAESVNGTAGAVLSLDICQFASVSNTIGGKTVVLVFDDLEQCRIDPVDLLGAINEYCENQRFYTIIIANEDYMLKQEENLPIQGKDAQAHAREEQGTDHGRIPGARPLRYKEIKEKIVQRTVRISPDYSNIIGSVIESYATDDADYKKFLKSHAEQLRNLFDVGIPMTEADFMQSGIAGETIKKNYEVHTPHNIRSFRCAIQDFHRVFVLLTRHGVMEELNEWLYAFVMFTMAHRAGTVTDSARYGDLFTDIGVSQLYPSYYKDKYILGFEKT